MNLSMPRPAFTVVSSSVAALVLLGFASRFFQGRIPKPAENVLAKEDSEFLNRASTQKIDWQKPTPESFALGRRRDLPILLFIGNAYNPIARGFDQGVLLSPRVQAYLARNFLCIRVDSLAYPQFRNAFLPISRGIVGFPSGCQLWILDPSGKIVDLLSTGLGLNPTDENAIISALVEARQRFENPTGMPGSARYEEAQQRDIEALAQSGSQIVPDFGAFGRSLVDSVYARGGFGPNGPRIIAPEAWRYLLATGEIDAFRSSIDPVLQSPIVDLIDGGFFHGARDSDWVEIDFDKSAAANAAMLRVLSAGWALLRNPMYRFLAERTFDSLTTEFVMPTGIAACRASDAGASGRSDRTSFGVRKLRELLPEDADYRWAQTRLGLRVESNPRMTPRLTSLQTVEDREQLDRVIALLTKGTSERPVRTTVGLTDVSGYCVARLLEASRILGDPKRTDQAGELFSWLEMNRTGTDVVHSHESDIGAPYLGDYLGYADAALQHYLATGRYPSIQSGKAILQRALSLYGTGNPGGLNLGLAPKTPMPPTLNLPELADTASEAALAQAIKLCQDYARLFPEELQFRQFPSRATARYGQIATLLGNRGSGFFLAAQGVFNDDCFVSVGAKAQEMADALAARQPFRLCFAAFGAIRSDIQRRGPGVYIVRGEQVQGPFTVEAATARVSPYLTPPG